MHWVIIANQSVISTWIASCSGKLRISTVNNMYIIYSCSWPHQFPLVVISVTLYSMICNQNSLGQSGHIHTYMHNYYNLFENYISIKQNFSIHTTQDYLLQHKTYKLLVCFILIKCKQQLCHQLCIKYVHIIRIT